MFGVLISGRLPQNNFQRVSETQFLIEVHDIENVNHIVVYMTGEMPFPDGYAGGVYFCYQSGGEQRWIYLGKICNQKPSAIFRITNLKHDTNSLSVTPFGGFGGPTISHLNAMIGISVEPISAIDALTPATETQTTNVNSFAEFTQKMLENFYNYASSFAKDAPDGQSYVPFSSLQHWFENFKRRLELNPNFWKSS
ncbi:OPI10 -like protein [Brachionus plicatilis]|uniref:OPI10-like protein n=1 Tax=Brachionus plicatilis TaxID=10195 RepID=A0A3M7PKP6_BRAPC|nr:OPI10 -like protein [Brachionus plicatilis]